MADLITLARAKYNLANLTTTTPEDTTLAALITACSEAIIGYCGHDFASTVCDELYDGSRESHLILRHYPLIAVHRVADRPTLVMRIRNTAATNQRATVAILSTGLKLIRVAAGVSTTDSSITWAAYPTLNDVALAINALGNGWSGEVIESHSDRASADLRADLSSKACHDRDVEIDLHLEVLNDWDADTERGWLFRSGGWSIAPRRYRVVYDAGYSSVPGDVQEACAEWVAAMFWLTKENPATGPTIPPKSVRDLLTIYRHHSL